MAATLHPSSAALVFILACLSPSKAGYSMYVWTDGFDSTVSGCTSEAFLRWDKHTDAQCYTNTWNTAAKRTWLWDTCKLCGREVSSIYLSGAYGHLKASYDAHTCPIQLADVKQMLKEGHSQVPGLEIYSLFADSQENVAEREMAKYVVWYNDNCAAEQAERFDGVAVNNEAFGPIKCTTESRKTAYLDKLQEIVNNTNVQRHGTLKTHYSTSWHWGECSGVANLVTWKGKRSKATEHMIDIFDSVDIQVASTTAGGIAERAQTGGADYAHSLGKNVFLNVYLGKNSICQISFFPTNCHHHVHTELDMFHVFDQFAAHGIGYAKPCIHYFKGIYSSGAHAGWPKHNTGHEACVPDVIGR